MFELVSEIILLLHVAMLCLACAKSYFTNYVRVVHLNCLRWNGWPRELLSQHCTWIRSNFIIVYAKLRTLVWFYSTHISRKQISRTLFNTYLWLKDNCCVHCSTFNSFCFSLMFLLNLHWSTISTWRCNYMRIWILLIVKQLLWALLVDTLFEKCVFKDIEFILRVWVI